MGQSAAALTVILPVRNEARNIGPCLRAFPRQTHRGRVRIVVAANGCTDATVDLAHSASAGLPRDYDLRIVELTPPSKPAAVNAGEKLALDGHRVYLDADAILSDNALASISRALDAPDEVHLCAPRRRIREPRSYSGRCYSRVWSTLPYIQDSIIFSGVYAVSQHGRERWTGFPPIQSEDKFVRLHFSESEQRQLTDAYSEVQVPEGAWQLFRARLRWCRGNHDLSRKYPDLTASERSRYRGALRALAGRPDVWPQVPCYAMLHLAASLLARVAPRANEHRWER